MPNYTFKNQPTATVTIERFVDGATGETLKLAGINGEQNNAGNLQTAIADFIGIGGIGIAKNNKALQRTINQAVESDGADPQLTLSPTSFTMAELSGASGGKFAAITSEVINKTVQNHLALAQAMTLSGKKPAGANVDLDGNNSSRVSLRFFPGEHTYTTGSDNATITIHMEPVTIEGTVYGATDLTFTLMNGVASEFEDIS